MRVVFKLQSNNFPVSSSFFSPVSSCSNFLSFQLLLFPEFFHFHKDANPSFISDELDKPQTFGHLIVSAVSA